MQFIVIYGTRCIYGGQSRLPGDWEAAGLGRGGRPLARKDVRCRSRGLGPILGIASPARASGSLSKPMPPASAHPTPPIPSARLSPATSQGLRSRWGCSPCSPLSLVWPLGGWHAGPRHVWGLTREEECCGRAPGPAGKGGFWTGPGQPGPLAASAVAPAWSVPPWPLLLKCHFLSGPQWVCLPVPSPRPQLVSVSGKPKPWLHRIAL